MKDLVLTWLKGHLTLFLALGALLVGLWQLGVFDNASGAELAQWRAEKAALLQKYEALSSEQQRLRDQAKRQAEQYERDRALERARYNQLSKRYDEILLELRAVDSALPERPAL